MRRHLPNRWRAARLRTIAAFACLALLILFPVFCVAGSVRSGVWAAFLLLVPLALLCYLAAASLGASETEIRRRLKGICLYCGYDLTGNVSGVCPECGTKIEEGPNPPESAANRRTDRINDGPGSGPPRGLRWGLIPITLGVCALIGVPIFDTMTPGPWHVHRPILDVGRYAAILACLTGAAAGLIRSERMAGIIGAILGVLALLLLPSLERA